MIFTHKLIFEIYFVINETSVKTFSQKAAGRRVEPYHVDLFLQLLYMKLHAIIYQRTIEFVVKYEKKSLT